MALKKNKVKIYWPIWMPENDANDPFELTKKIRPLINFNQDSIPGSLYHVTL